MRAMASLWDLWSAATAERNKSHCLAVGREAANLDRPLQIWKTGSDSGKAFNSGEEKAGSIDNIGDSRYLADGRLL